MAKYCDICRQTYSVEHASCPFCEVPVVLDRSRSPVSTNEVTPLPSGLSALPANRLSRTDRAAPIAAGPIQPPAESSNHRDNRVPSLGPRSAAKMLHGQSAGGADSHPGEDNPNTNSADIDLGCPVPGNRPGELGPPSGASFVSWTSLIDQRKDFEDGPPSQPAPQAGSSARSLLGNVVDAAKSATKLPTTGVLPRASVWLYVAAVAIGLVLALLVKLIW